MSLKIENLSKRYESEGRDGVDALNGIDIDLPSGAFLTLLGPSGCGKSTLLNMISGLDRPTGGRIAIDDRVVFDSERSLFLEPAQRNISMVFQSYAIWPHMSVSENIDFPLRYGTQRKTLSPAQRAEIVAESLRKVHLEAFGDRPAPLLSGGQQQRVSLARALAQRPSIILLDEPLSNLDASLREHMQKEIRSIVANDRITAVYVTHDQKEALSMSDLIVLMRDGHVEQVGTPREIYYRPRTPFVAKFMGSPNLIEADVAGVDVAANRMVVRSTLGTLRVALQDDLPVREGARVILVLKQEDIRLVGNGQETYENTFQLDVSQTVFMGDRVELILDLGSQSLSAYTNARRWQDARRVQLGLDGDDIHYIVS